MARLTRRFEFESIRIDIEEILSDEISGAVEHHGSHLWPSSVVLAAVLHRTQMAAGKRVLELGSGCGLPGMVAAQSAVSTILSDGYESGE